VRYDFDWLVIGSGFGGSVSALRLAQKGHRVGVLECGRRFADKDFPSSTADLKRYFWTPRLGMKGIFRLTTFKDVSVVAGLPKTRSGKILRKTMREIADGLPGVVPSTIEDPAVVEALRPVLRPH